MDQQNCYLPHTARTHAHFDNDAISIRTSSRTLIHLTRLIYLRSDNQLSFGNLVPEELKVVRRSTKFCQLKYNFSTTTLLIATRSNGNKAPFNNAFYKIRKVLKKVKNKYWKFVFVLFNFSKAICPFHVKRPLGGKFNNFKVFVKVLQ